jgi:uncharacterized MAPEG superfamily protein
MTFLNLDLAGLGTELTLLGLATALGVVQVVLVVIWSGLAGRTPWAIGARDGAGPQFGTMGARLDRALKNFGETFPLFAAAILLATVANRHGNATLLGSELYFWGRVVYVPLYAFGIPVLRTIVWTIASAGIALVLLGVFGMMA